MSTPAPEASSIPHALPSRPSILLLSGLGILCTMVTVVFARLAYGLVLPAMREDLGLSYTQAANLGTVTAMGYLTLLLYAGVFAGRFGGKRAIMTGLSLAATGFLLLSLVSAYGWLLLAMTLLGFGTAFAFTPLISLLGSWYPDRRGTVIGFANSGVGLGILISGALVPALTNAAGPTAWRLVWGIFFISAMLTLALTATLLREPPRHAEAVSVRHGLASVYRNRHVVVIGAVYGILGATYIVQTLFMFSFALESGVTPITAGRLVALMGLLSVVAGPAWGWAADHIGHANALLICMLLSCVATIMPVLHAETPVFVLHYVLMGASVSGLFTSILAASTSTVKQQHAAMAVSFVTVFFALGQLLGPAIAGLLIDWQQDFRLTFSLSSMLLIFGAILGRYSRKFVTR
ncbi:MFS transporter [Pseudohongiella sp.]|uniref:Major facilitator superfamily (MFS) profile domain-containing protein n=1 Tax=marine sediment metagenome TaxID=412755 RepID=A0A0F9W2N4_9ZZZZ|nr:MFS transporter [Pseudohongiella sp.]